MGQTPLLCAVKEHGVGSRKSHLYIDNNSTILCLLKYGANPMNTVIFLISKLEVEVVVTNTF